MTVEEYDDKYNRPWREFQAEELLRSSAELIPEWKNAMQSNNPNVNLVEVPITSNMITLSTERKVKDGKVITQKSTATFRRLIVARRPDGHTEMFVVTVLPFSKKGQKRGEHIKKFRYLGGTDFSGRVFCSTLDGKFVEAWEYSNGNRSPLRLTTRIRLAEQGDNLEKGEYQSILFTEAIMTRAGTYNTLNEAGGDKNVCDLHNQENCPNCLEEAIVTACRYCPKKLEPEEKCPCRCSRCRQSPCACCTDCSYYPCRCLSDCPKCRPFACKKCTLCGNHLCYGSCINTGGGGSGETDLPDPCNHQICENCLLPISFNNSPTTRNTTDGCEHNWCTCLWWTKDHDRITQNGLKTKLTRAQYKKVQEGQKYIDTQQEIPEAPFHAMIAPGQTKEQAKEIMKDFFCKKVIAFANNDDFVALGMALHPIQDAYSPAHDFNVWTGANLLPHLFESLMEYPHQAQTAARATNNVYEDIIGSQKPMTEERAQAIFEAWKGRYENKLD